MRSAATWMKLWVALWLAGCVVQQTPTPDLDQRDGSSPGFDQGLSPDGSPPDATRPLDASPDAAAPDAQIPDGASLEPLDADPADPDAAPDAEPATPDAAPDAEPAGPDGALDRGLSPDGALDQDPPPDAALDLSPPDAAEPDLSPPDAAPDLSPPDAAVLAGFVTGTAAALDGRSPVTVRGGGAVAVTDAEGTFRLGPLPGGPVQLSFSAERHQPEALEIDVPAAGERALAEPVELYRGVRITPAGADRIEFSLDDAWLVFSQADRLVSRPTAGGDARELVADGFEVFLGFVPGAPAAVTRQRTRPGIAGDLYQLPLDGGDPIRLFIEAQPWLRWLPDGRALAMVHTRDALSRLEVVRPGEAPEAVAEGVPWLLVATLAEAQVAFAAGEGPGFGIYLTGLDGAAPLRVDGGGLTGDAFLATTPGQRGLLWLTPDGQLWRWTFDQPAEPLADGVLANPRPRFLADGRLVFWRRDGARESLWLLDEAAAEDRLLAAGADGGSFTPLGAEFYVHRPGLGLWRGDWAGDGAVAIPAPVLSYLVVAGSVLALAEGQVWRFRPDLGPARVVDGPGPLSSLSTTVGGATAWEAATQSLWWIPQAGDDRPAEIIAQGALAPTRQNAPGGNALFARDGGGWRWIPLPPGDGRQAFGYGPEVDQIVSVIDGRTMLTRDAAGTLWQVDIPSGEAFGWARGLGQVRGSGRGGFTAYTSDRGLFLVPMRAEAP